MNAKLLFAATLAISLASSLVMAQEARPPLTRAQVVADLQQAASNGTRGKSDYDFDAHDFSATSRTPRDQVLAELAAARSAPKLPGSLSSRTYNQFGRDLIRPSIVERADVRAEVRQALANGTLAHSDYHDYNQMLVARRAAPPRPA